MRYLRLITFIAFTSFVTTSQACDQKVDSHKTFLFIDTNFSIKEVEAAKQAACERGERFMVWPDGKKADNFRKDNLELLTLEDELSKNNCPIYSAVEKDEKYDYQTCSFIKNKYDPVKKKLEAVDWNDMELNKANIKKAFKKAKGFNGAITSLVLSGHDGSGEFTGDDLPGEILKADLFKVFDDVFSRRKKDQLKTILLWGCYTGTYAETLTWKENFPGAKSIVGFYGSAPLAIRSASSGLMLDFLRKEKDLQKDMSQDELKHSLQDLNSFMATQPGLLINSCNGESTFYAHKYNQDKTITATIANAKDVDKLCEVVKEEWGKQGGLKWTYESYYEGYLPVPDNTSTSGLRNIYSFVRQNQHCFKDSSIDANKIGLLLFWKGVKTNFAHVYDDLMTTAQQELDQFVKESEADDKAYQDITTQLNDHYLKKATWYGDSREKILDRINGLKDKDADHKALYDFMLNHSGEALPIELEQKRANNSSLTLLESHLISLRQQQIAQNWKEKETTLVQAQDKAYAKYQSSSALALHASDFKFMNKKNIAQDHSNFMSRMRNMNAMFSDERFKEHASKLVHVEKAYKKMDQLLYQLDTSCMSFLEWHSYSYRKKLPRDKCEGKK